MLILNNLLTLKSFKRSEKIIKSNALQYSIHIPVIAQCFLIRLKFSHTNKEPLSRYSFYWWLDKLEKIKNEPPKLGRDKFIHCKKYN